MIYGTPCFVSTQAAYNYYYDYGYTHTEVDRKIAEGEIFIGEPPVKAGDTVLIDPDEQRYFIVTD